MVRSSEPRARRFSAAARADYALAAAKVLTGSDQAGRMHELAGDSAYTLAKFAAELSRQAGRPVTYRVLSEADYRGVLLGAGMPEPLAAVLADEDHVLRTDTLLDDGQVLSRLIGRPTTPMPVVIAQALKARARGLQRRRGGRCGRCQPCA